MPIGHIAAYADAPTDNRKFYIEQYIVYASVRGKDVAARSSSPEDPSSKTFPMAEPTKGSRPLTLQWSELLHSIQLAIAGLYISSKNFVNRSRVRGNKNETNFRGEGNDSEVEGNDNSVNSDSRSQTIWIVAIVAVAFVAYKALSR